MSEYIQLQSQVKLLQQQPQERQQILLNQLILLFPTNYSITKHTILSTDDSYYNLCSNVNTVTIYSLNGLPFSLRIEKEALDYNEDVVDIMDLDNLYSYSHCSKDDLVSIYISKASSITTNDNTEVICFYGSLDTLLSSYVYL